MKKVEERIKTLREEKSEINKELKQLLEHGDAQDEVEFPLIFSFDAVGHARSLKKIKTFSEHDLPYAVLSLSWRKAGREASIVCPSNSGGRTIMVYLGNKKKPKGKIYHVEIKITPAGKKEFKI